MVTPPQKKKKILNVITVLQCSEMTNSVYDIILIVQCLFVLLIECILKNGTSRVSHGEFKSMLLRFPSLIFLLHCLGVHFGDNKKCSTSKCTSNCLLEI